MTKVVGYPLFVRGEGEKGRKGAGERGSCPLHSYLVFRISYFGRASRCRAIGESQSTSLARPGRRRSPRNQAKHGHPQACPACSTDRLPRAREEQLRITNYELRMKRGTVAVVSSDSPLATINCPLLHSYLVFRISYLAIIDTIGRIWYARTWIE